MKVNTIIGILLISTTLYAKSAVAVEEQLNHNLRRLEKPSCGDGKVSGKEDCEPPNTATCDANCKSIDIDKCDTVRCADACTKDDAGLNCDVGTTCTLCDDPNEAGCTRNDCIADGVVCVEQSFKCVPTTECIDPVTGVCECATVNCLIDPCDTDKCGSGEVCKSNFCGGCNAVCEPGEIITTTTVATKPTTTTTESAPTLTCANVRCTDPCLNDPCVSTQKACNACYDFDVDVGCTGTCGPLEGGVFCGGYKCEGCIQDGDACSGNCSGCCSKTSTNLGGGLGKICG